MLLSGSATTSGTGDLDPEFNLSHVCTGTTPTTTTAPPTTTTIEVSPTTVAQGPAVGAGAAQQLPRTGSFSLPMLLVGLGLMVGGAIALARSGPRADALSEL
jgi:LPXTG-motif cell wall-anchored protein